MSKRTWLFAAIILSFGFSTPIAHGFRCCSNPSIQKVVTAYLEAQEGLSSPKPAFDKEKLAAAVNAAQGDSSLPADEKAILTLMAADLQKLTVGTSDQVVPAFTAISQKVLFLALNHPGGSLSVREAFCPEIGPWLQQGAIKDSDVPKSPYFKACGQWR